MTKPTQPITPGHWVCAFLFAVIFFVTGAFLLSATLFRITGELWIYGAPSFNLGAMPPYFPDKQENLYLNGQLVLQQVTHKDGTIEIRSGDPAVLNMARFWTIAIAACIGLLGGLCGWYIARRASRCPVPAIESPPPSP